MNTIQLSLPDSLHRRLKEMAEQDQVTVDQFVATALAEKMSALMTRDYLDARAQRADRIRFEAALSKVPDAEPEPQDRQ